MKLEAFFFLLTVCITAGGPNSRLTDIYDDYLGGYAEEEPPLPEDSKKVQAWASRTQPGPPTGPSRPVTRAPSAFNASKLIDRKNAFHLLI